MREYIIEDLENLPKKKQELIKEWCFQIQVLGFNSGRHDLNLIKKYFVTNFSQGYEVKVATKQGKTM